MAAGGGKRRYVIRVDQVDTADLPAVAARLRAHGVVLDGSHNFIPIDSASSSFVARGAVAPSDVAGVASDSDTQVYPDTSDEPFLISYKTLRTAIGWIGILLPLVLALGNRLIFAGAFPDSISGYYYTDMRGILIGSLCAIGVFLITYNGYDVWDRLLTNVAGFSAIGVALFPTAPQQPSAAETAVSYAHHGFAAILLAALAVIALWLFRRGGPVQTRQKKQRDVVYLVCGCVITLGLAGAVAVSTPLGAPLTRLDPLFWCETVAVVAFGISWLIKGETLFLKDAVPAPAPAQPQGAA